MLFVTENLGFVKIFMFVFSWNGPGRHFVPLK